jgi:hypothetical protein
LSGFLTVRAFVMIMRMPRRFKRRTIRNLKLAADRRLWREGSDVETGHASPPLYTIVIRLTI